MEKVFAITDRYPTHSVTNGLRGLTSEHIKGKSFELNIQKVTNTDDYDCVYKVEKLLKTRKRGGEVGYFVNWKG